VTLQPLKIALSLIAALVGVQSLTQAAEQPNIVFIFTDDHCTQALSAYDPSRISTPNMDRIADEGMKLLYSLCATPPLWIVI